MNVLITGANGFLGNYLTSYLKKYQITALASSDLDLTDGQLVSKFFSSTEKFDVVVNCAAKGRYAATIKDEHILSSNLKIFMNLVDNRQHFGKLINIGTGAEFGLSDNVDSAKESEIFKFYMNSSKSSVT